MLFKKKKNVGMGSGRVNFVKVLKHETPKALPIIVLKLNSL